MIRNACGHHRTLPRTTTRCPRSMMTNFTCSSSSLKMGIQGSHIAFQLYLRFCMVGSKNAKNRRPGMERDSFKECSFDKNQIGVFRNREQANFGSLYDASGFGLLVEMWWKCAAYYIHHILQDSIGHGKKIRHDSKLVD